jgi:catechol 2,3-dioxygenase-like lactoylglutathione lyase family enzyme
MRIESFDHVALWVADRDALAASLTAGLGVHVIERTDNFTLVGAHARHGKLTLFGADGPRERGALVEIGLRVSSLERALARIDDGGALRAEGDGRLNAPEGLTLALVEAPGSLEYDLDHVTLCVRDPDRARSVYTTLGFEDENGRLRAGGGYIDLVEGEPTESERPLLNHIGLRVASASDHIEEARARKLEIADVVDAPNTTALFLWGPEHVELEYVEHKATFSLR